MRVPISMSAVPTRRRPNTRLTRAAAVAAAILSLVALVGPAFAAAPSQFRFTETVSLTDDSSCAFPIAVNLQVSIVGHAVFDAQGNFVSATVEQNATGTDSANGISLRENDHTVDFYSAQGYDKEVGTPIHVQLQGGGLVIRDAGYILFNPDGSVAFLHGPHPQLEGDTTAVCEALS